MYLFKLPCLPSDHEMILSSADSGFRQHCDWSPALTMTRVQGIYHLHGKVFVHGVICDLELYEAVLDPSVCSSISLEQVLGIQLCKTSNTKLHSLRTTYPHNYSRNLKTRRKGNPNPTYSSPNLRPQLHSSAHHTQLTRFHQTHRGETRETCGGRQHRGKSSGDTGICRGKVAEAVVKWMCR